MEEDCPSRMSESRKISFGFDLIMNSQTHKSSNTEDVQGVAEHHKPVHSSFTRKKFRSIENLGRVEMTTSQLISCRNVC